MPCRENKLTHAFAAPAALVASVAARGQTQCRTRRVAHHARQTTSACATLPRSASPTTTQPSTTSPSTIAIPASTQVPWAPDWRMLGPPLEAGELPAVLYFTLSAKHGLDETPYSDFARALLPNVRVFATTLPYHGTDTATNMQAFTEWQRVYASGGDVISRFSRACATFADALVERGIARHVYTAGLSRGGLVAAHVAMRTPNVKALVAFAPVVVLADLPEFNMQEEKAKMRVQRASLLNEEALAKLAAIPVRFYTGNFDRRVGTRNAFEVTHALAKKAYGDRGVRSPPHEFIMYCSIGSEGHGTPSDVFRDGARWVLEQAGK